MVFEFISSACLKSADRACKRQFIRVYPLMSCQSRVFDKGFGAQITFERPFLLVRSDVRRHQTFLGGCVGAQRINSTLENVAGMNSHVGGQVVLVFGSKAAMRTIEPLGCFMNQQMSA